jgi:hypothetical protein
MLWGIGVNGAVVLHFINLGNCVNLYIYCEITGYTRNCLFGLPMGEGYGKAGIWIKNSLGNCGNGTCGWRGLSVISELSFSLIMMYCRPP